MHGSGVWGFMSEWPCVVHGIFFSSLLSLLLLLLENIQMNKLYTESEYTFYIIHFVCVCIFNTICENLDIFAFEMTQYCEIIYGCAYFFAAAAFKYLYMCTRV